MAIGKNNQNARTRSESRAGGKMTFLQTIAERYCHKKWHNLSRAERRWFKKTKKYFLNQFYGEWPSQPLAGQLLTTVAIDMYLNYGLSRNQSVVEADDWFFAENRPGWYRQPWQPVTFDPVEA